MPAKLFEDLTGQSGGLLIQLFTWALARFP